MIIFINGAFGVGKTTVAERLVQRLPNSLLFDPEEVGFFLRNVLSPIDKPDDFQQYALWRSLVVSTASQFRRTYDRILVMPMTLWHAPYFEEVVGGLRRTEPDVYHFCLTAPDETIQARLLQRGNKSGDWCWNHIERCRIAFQSSDFDIRIPTESATPDEIINTLLATLPHRITMTQTGTD
jgi:hypothetical protein